MANHAAAGAYAFLLSAIPALLVIVYLSSLAAKLLRLDVDSAVNFLSPYLEVFGGGQAIKAFVGNPLTGFAGAFGLVNLVWAARLFVVSMQRGIRVVYAATATANPLRENALTFAVELLIMLAVVALIAASQIMRVFLGSVSWAPVRELFGAAVRMMASLLPFVALLLFVYITYRNVPIKKPRVKSALLSSALCVTVYGLFGMAIGFTMNVARYGLLYGLLGNLVIGLIKVYTFFWMYFFFAEFMYTIEYFDSLLFARFHRLQTATKTANIVERSLFSEPTRLIRKYARSYAAGELIFSAGDEGREAYYLYRGAVCVHLDRPPPAGGCPDGSEATVSRINEGEFFGEMASVLDESRSAWASAETDCTVFVFPPAIFKRYLAQDADAAKRLMGMLAARLKANNAILRQRSRP